jgi:hypothetical protein
VNLCNICQQLASPNDDPCLTCFRESNFLHEDVPEDVESYIVLIKEMEGIPLGYGGDKLRSELHEKICVHYELKREETQKVTDHMEKYDMNPRKVHQALLILKKEAALKALGEGGEHEE